MSAPIIAYRTKSLFIDSKEHLIAKLQVDYATMKSRFYLDEVLTVQIDENTNGVIGCITIGGTNESMHNIATRGGVGRIGNMIMLNDAGLNTKGNAIYSGVSVQLDVGILVTLYVNSAFYIDSDYAYVKWRKNPSGAWQTNTTSTGFDKNTSQEIGVFLYSASVVLNPGEYIDIIVGVSNAEGDKESTQITFQLPLAADLFGYAADYGSVAYFNYNNYPPSTYYFDNYVVEVGTIISSNATSQINVPDGYIANHVYWYKIEEVAGVSTVAKYGNVGVWDTGDPATPTRFIPINFIGRHASWSIGCANIGSLSPVTIYFDNVSNVYRTTASASGSFATGAYYTGTFAPNSSPEFIWIASNGVSNGYYYNCTDGFIPVD